METGVEIGQLLAAGDRVDWKGENGQEKGKIVGIAKEIQYLVESDQGRLLWVPEMDLRFTRKPTFFDITDELALEIPVTQTQQVVKPRNTLKDFFHNFFRLQTTPLDNKNDLRKLLRHK
jgi:hypothetical protein